MNSVKQFIAKNSTLAHTITVVWGFLIAFYFSNQQAHDYINSTAISIYYDFPKWLQGLTVGLIIPLLTYMKSQKNSKTSDSNQSQKIVVIALCLFLVGSMSACKAVSTPLPNGAINSFDFQSYETLMVAQAALTTLKAQAPQLETQVPAFKEYINVAILNYNEAEKAWQTYHSTGTNSAGVTAALTVLSTDILKLQGLIPVGGK